MVSGRFGMNGSRVGMMENVCSGCWLIWSNLDTVRSKNERVVGMLKVNSVK